MEKLVYEFEKLSYNEYAVVFSDMKVIDSNGMVVNNSYMEKTEADIELINKPDFDYTCLS